MTDERTGHDSNCPMAFMYGSCTCGFLEQPTDERTKRERLADAVRFAYRHGYAKGHNDGEAWQRWEIDKAVERYMTNLPKPTAALLTERTEKGPLWHYTSEGELRAERTGEPIPEPIIFSLRAALRVPGPTVTVMRSTLLALLERTGEREPEMLARQGETLLPTEVHGHLIVAVGTWKARCLECKLEGPDEGAWWKQFECRQRAESEREHDTSVPFDKCPACNPALGAPEPEPAEGRAPQVWRDMLALKPSAHAHLTLQESYAILARLFAKVGEAHVLISRSAFRVRGMSISERVRSLIEQATPPAELFSAVWNKKANRWTIINRERGTIVTHAKPVLSDFDPECPRCLEGGMNPSHNGSTRCESGSIASGGDKAHCTCDTCF